MTQFKAGQKVRIKGTDIEGVLYSDAPNRFGIANVESYDEEGCLADYYVPVELVEAVVEPITVTFDPVELPATVRTSSNTLAVMAHNGYVDLTSPARRGEDWEFVRSLLAPEARKLALAILTITDGPHGTESQSD